MGFRNISAWSIRNPVPSIVLFLMLTAAGIVSFMRMDVNNQPDIDFPVVIVSISQPGAAPTELETQVTQRVEAAVRSLQGIDEINSEIEEGTSTTIVQLDIGTPIDRAVSDVRDAISQIRGNLPEGILEPQIQRANTTDNDLGSYSAIATDMTVEQLSWYIDNTVAKELLSIPGLSAVERNGGVSREIRVILDPARLQAQGMTATQVNQQLRAVNLNAAGGRAEIAGSEQSVRVLGNAANAYTLGQTQIAVGGGRTVRLDDIAQVRDLYAERRSSAAVDGRPVISFDFKRAKGASDVTVFDDVTKKLATLETRNPNVKFKLRVDGSKYAKEQYSTAIDAMVEGAVLAVFVVFLFLRDWRATFISALAIPLSAIPAFWFMDLLGFTLNQMTLMALSLVAGVLVDDAIVEIENIVRHMRMGKTAYQASIDAADEIGLAVLATTMAIVAVFLPVGLMPGVSGQFFKNFGLTIVASVLMSLAVARLLTPMIAAYFLKSSGTASHGEGRMMDGYMATLRWTLDDRRAKLSRAKGGLHRVTSLFRDHRIWICGVGALAFLLTIVCFMVLPQQFQPAQDNDRSSVSIEMVPGTTLAQTQIVVDRVATLLRAQPLVETVYARAGVGNGRVTAQLKEDRDVTSTEFERNLAPQLALIPDARANFQSQFGWGGSNRDLSITLGGDDPVMLRRTANKIVTEMQTLPNLVAPRIAGDLNRPEIIITPRLDLAASLGVTTSALSSAVRIATLGDIDQNSARFSLSDRQIPIRVALDQTARERLSTIQNLPVATQAGGSVPLSLVAQIGFGAGPTKIDRTGQQRQLTIGADLAPGIVSGVAMKQIKALPTMRNLPLGVGELVLGGQSKWQAEMIANFVIAVVAGLFLVLSVLVLLYRRLLPPLVNMGSLLLAPLGGLLGLIVTGNLISMPVFIGMLMLLGIVAKNSILLIDFALEEMNKGVPIYDAIMDAGHKRAQPIVMTTVAMVAGMIPTALSLQGDGSFRAPMGITVIGGLTLSTVLTLLIVPATFSLAVGIERWAGPRLSRRLLTYRPGDEGLDGGVPAIDNGPPRAGAIPAPAGRIGTATTERNPPSELSPALRIVVRMKPFARRPALVEAAPTGLVRMRIVAAGLLVVMAATYAAARSLQDRHPAIGFLRAFAEAAMVGGLADWFAVTALFRHPLGLPIPHTAIIPRNKDRIGDQLALFLRENFLVPRVVARRMLQMDVAGVAGRWLANPQGGSKRLTRGSSRLAVEVLQALDQERLGGMVRGAMVQRLRDLDIAPLLGRALSAAIAENRHLPILEGATRWVGKMLGANEHLVRAMVHDRAGSILRWTGLDETLSNKIIDGLQKLVTDIADDPEHPVRGKAGEALATLAHDLEHDPAMRMRVEALKTALLENPAMQEWINGLWEQARAAMLRMARDPDKLLAGKFGDALRQLGETLQQDRRLGKTINRFVRRAVVGVVADYGDAIVRLVSETVRGWDAETITRRLENAVGKDLQFIRINGTIVGGLVGLAIHAIDRAI